VTNLPFRWWLMAAVAAGLIVAATLAFFLLRPTPKPSPPAPIAKVHAQHVAVNPMLPAPAPAPPPKPAPHVPTAFEREQAMSFGQMMARWDPFILEAAKRFNVPAAWIRAVLRAESGGRTMLAENLPITSTEGAMGLMQLMPETYDEMRKAYRLGADPYDPHDNIIAGTAYLRILRTKYGYPQMFAAYNDGPGNLEQRMIDGGLLPAETRNYVATITGRLEGLPTGHGNLKFTRPDGSAVWIDGGSAVSVRAAFPGEYPAGVQAVITIGRVHQAVQEPLAKVRSAIRARGGGA
jgi:soluble lytic murein transglycosylase-like protein